MSTSPSPCRGPVVLEPVGLSPLTTACVAWLLRPFPERVVLSEEPRGAADVGLVDPDQPHETWHRCAGLPLVGLVRDATAECLARAVELGVAATLGPDLRADELVQAVEGVRDRAQENASQTSSGLSARELEVVSLVCQGLSNAEIAGRLFLSINSVKTYVRTAYRKMGVTSRSQAVLWGYHRGL